MAEKVNVNKASAYELAKVPGVDWRQAKAIVEYRDEHQPFELLEDLTQVPGIDMGMVASWRPVLTVLGEDGFEGRALVVAEAGEVEEVDTSQSRGYIFVDIQVPQKSKYKAGAATNLVNTLLQAHYHRDQENRYLRLSIDMNQGEMYFTAFMSSQKEDLSQGLIRSQVKISYPEAAVIFDATVSRMEAPFYRRVNVLRPQVDNSKTNWDHYMPLLNTEEAARADPLVFLTQAFGEIEADERAQLYLIPFGSYKPNQAGINDALTQSKWEAGKVYPVAPPRGEFWARVEHFNKESEWLAQSEDKYKERMAERITQKLSQKLTFMAIAICFDTPHKERAEMMAKALRQPMRGFLHPSFNSLLQGVVSEERFIKDPDNIPDSDEEVNIIQRLVQMAEPAKGYNALLFPLAPDEIATLWHPPHEDFTARGIVWTDASAPLPEAMRGLTGAEGTLIGENKSSGKSNPVYLPYDIRGAHTIVTGKTRMGKTSLVQHMIADDIRRGAGVCVIDPAGGLVQQLLQASIPEEREGDVVVLDIGNRKGDVYYPPPINLLASFADERGDFVPPMLGQIMERIFDEFSGTRMAELLDLAVSTLAYSQGVTIRDVRRMFRDEVFRSGVLEKVDNFDLLDEWDDVVNYRDSMRERSLNALLNRVNKFLRNKRMSAITCHPNPTNLSIRRLVEEKKVVLVSLGAKDSGLSQAERLLLGTTLVSQVQMAVKGGAALKSPEPFLLYVDEAHNFRTGELQTMLSEARQFNLGLILVTQFFDQLDSKVRQAVDGNVNSYISFRVGKETAQSLAHFTAPMVGMEDLLNLPAHTAVVVTERDTEVQPAFTVAVLPPPHLELEDATATSVEQRIREKSIENYTPLSYDEINAALLASRMPRQAASGDEEDGEESFIEPNI